MFFFLYLGNLLVHTTILSSQVHCYTTLHLYVAMNFSVQAILVRGLALNTTNSFLLSVVALKKPRLYLFLQLARACFEIRRRILTYGNSITLCLHELPCATFLMYDLFLGIANQPGLACFLLS